MSTDQSSLATGGALSLERPYILILCLRKFVCNGAPFILRKVTTWITHPMGTLLKPQMVDMVSLSMNSLLFFSFFKLEDNGFTILCWFLPYNDEN